MKLSMETGVYLAFNAYCAVGNLMLAPQTFIAGFALGVIGGLGHSIYTRIEMPNDSDKSIKKCIKQMNPSPGAFGTFVAFVALKVNEYALNYYLPFYAISSFAGVPLGYSFGKTLAVIPGPWYELKFNTALVSAKF